MLNCIRKLLNLHCAKQDEILAVPQKPILKGTERILTIIGGRTVISKIIDFEGKEGSFIRNVDKYVRRRIGERKMRRDSKRYRSYWMYYDRDTKTITYRLSLKHTDETVVDLTDAILFNLSEKDYKLSYNDLHNMRKLSRQLRDDELVSIRESLEKTTIHFVIGNTPIKKMTFTYSGKDTNVPLILRLLACKANPNYTPDQIVSMVNSAHDVYVVDAQYYNEILNYANSKSGLSYEYVEHDESDATGKFGYMVYVNYGRKRYTLV